ncbi:MAG: TraR/DksA family transcriptional regulator [Nitrospinota bacterium]
MKASEAEVYAERLKAIRAKYIKALDRTISLSNEEFGEEVADMNDEASRTTNRRVVLEYGAKQREIVVLINEALDRIDNNEYGDCVECGRAISSKRLDLLPYAPYCIECQELLEGSAEQ